MSDTVFGTDFLVDPSFQEGVDEYLLQQIRAEDRVVLEIGCKQGDFAAKLKQLNPSRVLLAVASTGYDASPRRSLFQALYQIDIEKELPPIELGSVDCIVMNGVLPQMRDPSDVLRRLKPLLRAGGRIVFAIPNAQHFSALASMISGDFQAQAQGPFQSGTTNLLAAANFQKLCLNAGFMPGFIEAYRIPMPEAMAEAYLPLLQHLHLNDEFFSHKASIYQYICVAIPMASAQPTTGGITFIAAVNNFRQLQDNLLASPVLQNNRHEIIPVTGATSAADAFRKGVQMSLKKNKLFVLLHQDIYLPEGWDDKLISSIAESEKKFGPVGIAGVFGVVRTSPTTFIRAGNVLDRLSMLATGHQFPARAVSLDEIVLAFPVQNGSLVGLEEDLGFHMYGSEVCIAAEEAGQVAVIVDAPCLHNSESGYDPSSPAFMESVRAFAQRRSGHFPYATTCIDMRADGTMKFW